MESLSHFFKWSLRQHGLKQESRTPGYGISERSRSIPLIRKSYQVGTPKKLGLNVSSEYQGLYYGSFVTKSGNVNLGLYPLPNGL
jgi:hypothetical protein